MAYADCNFYKNEYCGNVVPDTDFPKYAERASDRIDALTFDRLANGLPTDGRAENLVKKAVCSVAEALYQIDSVAKSLTENIGTEKAEDGRVTGKVITSVSAGNESVSFSTGASEMQKTVYGQACMDKKVENILIQQMAFQYLRGVKNDDGIYLLYAGF